jgi:hypothetical protein
MIASTGTVKGNLIANERPLLAIKLTTVKSNTFLTIIRPSYRFAWLKSLAFSVTADHQQAVQWAFG